MTRPFRPQSATRYPPLIGCDEVGRGPLAGPVVAAAVWFAPAALPPDLLANLDDSKKLSTRQRLTLATQIRHHARVSVAAVSAAHIDRLNIRQATLTAMHRAIVGIGIDCAVAIDGRDTPPGLANATACIGGDAQVPQIAAASIIAKVLRDALMTRLARRHPGYGWEHNAGYGTAEHLSALARVGPTAHHRYSFAPVKKEKEKGLRREGA